MADMKYVGGVLIYQMLAEPFSVSDLEREDNQGDNYSNPVIQIAHGCNTKVTRRQKRER